MRRIQNFGVLYFVLVSALFFLFGSGSEAGSINKDRVGKCKISRFEVLKKISGSSQVEKFSIPDFEINEDQIRRDISQLKQTGEIGYSKVTADINVSALNDLDDSKNISKQSDNSLTLNQDLNLFSQDLQAVIISRKIKTKERSLEVERSKHHFEKLKKYLDYFESKTYAQLLSKDEEFTKSRVEYFLSTEKFGRYDHVGKHDAQSQLQQIRDKILANNIKQTKLINEFGNSDILEVDLTQYADDFDRIYPEECVFDPASLQVLGSDILVVQDELEKIRMTNLYDLSGFIKLNNIYQDGLTPREQASAGLKLRIPLYDSSQGKTELLNKKRELSHLKLKLSQNTRKLTQTFNEYPEKEQIIVVTAKSIKKEIESLFFQLQNVSLRESMGQVVFLESNNLKKQLINLRGSLLRVQVQLYKSWLDFLFVHTSIGQRQ